MRIQRFRYATMGLYSIAVSYCVLQYKDKEVSDMPCKKLKRLIQKKQQEIEEIEEDDNNDNVISQNAKESTCIVVPGAEFDLEGHQFIVVERGDGDTSTIKNLRNGDIFEMSTEIVEELVTEYLE
mmetsp:Transcript_12360/g.19003  ORF Transcript_12360/g.19003 Transcript_12360/m.19003 type:complete len:125 (+) Transcript_12360:987-1361(+)